MLWQLWLLQPEASLSCKVVSFLPEKRTGDDAMQLTDVISVASYHDTDTKTAADKRRLLSRELA